MGNDENFALGGLDNASPNMEDNGNSSLSQQITQSFPSNDNLTGHHHQHHTTVPCYQLLKKTAEGWRRWFRSQLGRPDDNIVPIFTRSDPPGVPRTLQPFAISTTLAGGMGFPFTAVQWKELERQAMIYEYIMASLPVPSHLLIPTTPKKLSADRIAPMNKGSVYSLTCGNRDLELGRCKRTDGKKWRCSRAPSEIL